MSKLKRTATRKSLEGTRYENLEELFFAIWEHIRNRGSLGSSAHEAAKEFFAEEDAWQDEEDAIWREEAVAREKSRQEARAAKISTRKVS